MNTADAYIAQQLQQGFDALNRGQLEAAAKACQAFLPQRPELGLTHTQEAITPAIARFFISRSMRRYHASCRTLKI